MGSYEVTKEDLFSEVWDTLWDQADHTWEEDNNKYLVYSINTLRKFAEDTTINASAVNHIEQLIDTMLKENAHLLIITVKTAAQSKFICYSSDNIAKVYNGATGRDVVVWNKSDPGSVPRKVVRQVCSILFGELKDVSAQEQVEQPRFEWIDYSADETGDGVPISLIHDVVTSEDILTSKDVSLDILNKVYTVLGSIK